MLTKPVIVTAIPAVEGRAFRAASETCYNAPPTGTGGDTATPPPPPPDPGYVPPAGAPIVLEHKDGSGGYTTSESVAPAPAGYVCRLETIIVYMPGQLEPATVYNTICTEQ